MKTKQSPHQPFTKPFWKLLGISMLSLLFVYGGIVWATVGDKCTEYSNGNEVRVGVEVSNVSGWSVVRKICQRVNNDGLENNIEVKTSNINNKTIRLTNTGSKDYFVPTRTDAELNAFLNTAKNGNLKSDITTLCEVGLSNTADSVFGNSIKGCDTQTCLAPTLTYLETGTPGNVYYTLDGGAVTGLEFFRSTDNQVTWGTQGTTPVPSPGLASIFSGDYIRAQANCSDGSTSDYSNAITTGPGAGSCVGTYTVSSSFNADWDGNPLEWEQDVLYNDAKQPIYRCSTGWVPANVNVYSTVGTPYMNELGEVDNYYCQYIEGTNQLNGFGNATCTQNGSSFWSISSGNPTNTNLSSQSQSITDQMCNFNYTAEHRFWSPGNSGNWSEYWVMGGNSFYPGYVSTKNDIQGALIQSSGLETKQCSALTPYGENYCDTNPTNSTCNWVAN